MLRLEVGTVRLFEADSKMAAMRRGAAFAMPPSWAASRQ